MNARFDDTRQHLLDTGYQIMAGKGFSGVGLAEILAAAQVPKGSFYHYFESKEQYGQALLENYFAAYVAGLEALVADLARPGRERLLAFWQRWLDRQADACCTQRCLVVKLAAEVADLSDAMRLALAEGTGQIVAAQLAELIRQGEADASLPALDAAATAQTLYALWIGASLLDKVHRDGQALHRAMALTQSLLSPPA